MASTNFRRLFEHFDFDKNNEIDFGEIQVFFEVLTTLDPYLTINTATAQKYFDYADSNKDRKLSFGEFLRVVTQTLYSTDKTYQSLKKNFYTCELDESEQLSMSNFSKFVESHAQDLKDPRFTKSEEIVPFFSQELGRGREGSVMFDEFFLFINKALRKE